MSQANIMLDPYSVTAVPMQMVFGETPLSMGTAFFWEEGEQIYLITNWHNLAGVNPVTGANLSATGGRPDMVLALAHALKLGERVLMWSRLFDEAGQPRWLVHPKRGRDIDIAALPLDRLPDVNFYPINRLPSAPLLVSVGVDVHILGYPFAKELTDRDGLPVWKRGSIASEPQLLPDAEPYVLVDTASRPGMSGAPVIIRVQGSGALEGGATGMFGGAATRFFGIYAGRIVSGDALDAQLGRVYPERFIREVIAGGVRETAV